MGPIKLRHKIKKWTPVEVIWTDIYSVYGDVADEHVEKYSKCLRRTLGYVIVDAPDRLAIAHTDDRKAGSDNHISDAMVIIRGAIEKIVVLTDAKAK